MSESQVDINWVKLFIILFQSRKQILWFSICVSLLATIYCIFATPIFTSTVVINPPKLVDAITNINRILTGLLESGLDSNVYGVTQSPKNGDIVIGILDTKRVKDIVIKKFNLQQYYHQNDIELTRVSLSRKVKIHLDTKSEFISINVDDKNAHIATDIANYYVIALGQTISNVVNSRVQQRYKFYATQIENAKYELDKIENRINDFVKKNGVVAGKQVQIIANVVAQLQTQLVEAYLQLYSMRTYASEGNPDYKLLKYRISSLEKQLEVLNYQQSSRDSISSNLATDIAKEYANLLRDKSTCESVYKTLLIQYEAYKYDDLIEQSPTPIQVIDPAQIPIHKSKPKRLIIILFSLLSALIISCVYFIIRNHKEIIINANSG